ncbi:MAG: SRPBCC family protein [Acidimicrobiia bacterium]|nr:SRPBCC family protein [Acidimicrobiia bacterium]
MAATFRFDRTWWFSASPDELWAALTRTDEYPRWWSWLREFEADAIRPGVTARCRIQAPLPYSLRCDIRVDRVVPGSVIETTVSGDLRGPARLEVAPATTGSTARLVWSVDLTDPVLSRAARFGRPLMAWAHDTVVATGVEQFRRRALGPGSKDAGVAS